MIQLTPSALSTPSGAKHDIKAETFKSALVCAVSAYQTGKTYPKRCGGGFWHRDTVLAGFTVPYLEFDFDVLAFDADVITSDVSRCRCSQYRSARDIEDGAVPACVRTGLKQRETEERPHPRHFWSKRHDFIRETSGCGTIRVVINH